MRFSRKRTQALAGLLVLALVSTGPAIGSVDPIDLVSSAQSGPANATSTATDLSPDGRWVVFVSSASNLVSGDTNAGPDVFVKDMSTRVVERVSVDGAGSQMGGGSGRITPDGRYVVFVSGRRAWVRDRVAATTLPASPYGYHDSPYEPSISADGRYVAFSTIDRLVPDDTNSCLPLPPGLPPPQDYDYCRDVYVKDMLTGALTRASVSDQEAQGYTESGPGYITADGRYVIFSSAAWNLVSDDYNPGLDIFVRDLVAGTTRILTITSDGRPSNGQNSLSGISSDGRFVTFMSTATNLVLEDKSPLSDVYVLDRNTMTFTVESMVIPSRAGGIKLPLGPSISDDGRRVAFSVINYDAVGFSIDVFVRDRVKGATFEVATRPLGDRVSSALAARISANGSTLAFNSNRGWLVGGDTNGLQDAFLVRFASHCSAGGREDGVVTARSRDLGHDDAGALHDANCAIVPFGF